MKDIELDGDFAVLIPFTSGQKELWLSCQASLSGYSEVVNLTRFRVGCLASPDLLRQAVRFALRHTPLLNASIITHGAEPYFAAGADQDPDVRFLDFSRHEHPETAVKEYLTVFFEEPVDSDCLIRYALIHAGENESTLAFKSSHIVMDGLGSFFHAAFLADIYHALAQGQEPDFGEPCAFDEVYRKECAHRESSRFEKDMAYWRAHLERLPEKRIFRARPGYPDMLGNTRFDKYAFSDETSSRIERYLGDNGLTPNVYFTALHALAVSFMTGEKDIVIQTPVAYGERKVPARRQGSQIAMPPVLADLRTHATFGGLCADIVAQNGQFYRHILTPYQLAMRELPHKNLSFVADTFTNFLPGTPKGSPSFPILEAFQWHSEKEPTLFGGMIMREAETGRFSITVRSCRNHFSRQDVERYVRRLELLTEQLAAGVELPQLTYLLEEEMRELAVWQRGERRDYAVATMHGLFDAVAGRFARHPAVRDEQGTVLTYAEVREHSIMCAAWLAENGVGPGDVVAVIAGRCINLPEIVLGILRCGAVYLPVDPKASEDRLSFILADAGAVFTVDPADLSYRHVPQAGRAAEMPWQAPAVSPESPAYLIYTSGSTGRPKGVVAPHAGFVNMIQGQIETFRITDADRVLQFAPPIFDASLSELFMALHAGACLYPVSDACRNEPWGLRQYMTDNRISVVTFPPSYLHLFEREFFPGLRVLITAGEPPVAADALHHAATLDYFNAYGPTETCVCASMKRVKPDESLPITSGRPIPNGTAYILDAEGRALPAGMVGELWIGGAGVALGYHGNADLTGARFRPLPELGEPRAYATGDLALWSAQGEIVLVGRADDQVKIRGNRVELGEVAFLLERCAGVSQAAALVVRDASDQPALAAFLVLHAGNTTEAVVAWCRENLPAYMIPSFWHDVAAMPMTPTGKVDRNALKKLLKSSRAGSAQQELDPQLRALCDQALGGACRPGVSFFDQGGNSLTAMGLLHAIRSTFSVDIAFRQFVTCDTLYALQAMVREAVPQGPSDGSDEAPLSSPQFRVWAYQQANYGSIDYNMPLILEVRGERAEAFLDAFRQAVNGQELLCCTIAGDVDRPRFVRSGRSVPLHVTDFADAQSAMRHFDGRIHIPFDLRAELPVRLEAARLPDKTFLLLVLMHHIVGDGESLELLQADALGILHGETPVKGQLSTQVAFCRREEEYRQSDAHRADKAYWEAMAGETAALPFVRNRSGAMVGMPVPAPLMEGLEGLAGRTGTGVLAAFTSLVARFLCSRYGVYSLRVGIPVGLRETQEEFRTSGFFVNTVPLLIRSVNADGGADIEAAVRDVAGQLKNGVARSRYCPITPVPDVLVTQVHQEDKVEPGLSLRQKEPRLRASKFSASFILRTGGHAGVFLEHDMGSIPDGDSLLRQLLEAMAESLAEITPESVTGCVTGCVPETVSAPAARAADAGKSLSPMEALAGIWEEVLHSAPEAQSDFFRYGGDSIKAIQITGNLLRQGITGLVAADFLRTPKFGDLCALLERGGESGTPERADADSPDKVAYRLPQAGSLIPLLPIQHALVHGHPEHWKHYFMALPLALEAGVARGNIETWLRMLPERFESLRLAFSPDGAHLLPVPQVIRLHEGFTPAADSLTLFRAMARAVFAGLDPETGRTFGAALAEQDGERFLLLAGHHLVLDVISLDILRRDLLAHCQGGERAGERFGMATRAVEMDRLVAEGGFPSGEERLFWESVCDTPHGTLAGLLNGPVADSTDDGRVPEGRQDSGADRQGRKSDRQGRGAGNRIYLTRSLSGFRPDYSPSPLSDILAALSCALHGQGQTQTQTQPQPVFVALESHGRDALLPGFDASLSLGWFTALCPMPLVPSASVHDARKGVQPWIKEHFTARNSNAYGYLRLKDPARFAVESPICLNYLGVVASGTGSKATTQLSLAVPGAISELLHPDFVPDCPLELSVYFDEAGTLHVGAYFSPCDLSQDWVDGLMGRMTQALASLPAYSPPVPAGVLSRICDLCRCTPEEIEAVRLPDVSHEPMLYQALTPDQGSYTQQVSFHLRGDVQDFLLLSAWNRVVERHESLRSLYPMPHAGEFYRVVMRRGRVGAEYHDLSHLPAPMAAETMDRLLLEQRERGFDLAAGPLLRSQLFRLDADRVVVSWCFHHLLMDGWCMGILMHELLSEHARLAGRPVGRLAGQPAEALPPAVPLAEYGRWRTLFDEEAARAYWSSLLDGFVPLTGIAEGYSAQDAGEPETLERDLDASLSAALQEAAAAASITLPVLVQSVWALLLGVENGHRRDVVFGLVTSGRPAEVPGIDRAVGLFIQTLPLRVRWSEDTMLADVLADVKEQSLQQMRHGYLPLAEMGRNLLDHLMVFENYPFNPVLDGGRLEMLKVEGYEKIPYPLGISVIPGSSLRFRFLYDSGSLSAERVQALQERLFVALERVAASLEIPCGALEACIRDGAALPVSVKAAGSVAGHAVSVQPVAEAPECGAGADIESVVMQSYAAVLDCPVPSAEEDFFLLGGNSLLAMRLLAQLSKQLSVKVSVGDILTFCTPRSLAAHIASVKQQEASFADRIPLLPERDVYPLSSSQQRMWFLQRLHEDGRIYLIPFAARLLAPVDRAVLQQALQLVEERHSALRLRVSADTPRQRFAPLGSLQLEFHELPDAGACVQAARVVLPMAFGFDNPLVRVALYQSPEGTSVLAFCFHHIIFDGWSSEVFLRDLNRAYEAVMIGSTPAWEPLDIDYVSYAEWGATQESPDFAAMRQDLLPLPERLPLPLDMPRPAVQNYAGGVHVFALRPGQVQGLRRYVAEQGCTLFPALLALVKVFLFRHTGQPDIVIGCTAANREHDQVQNMIGLFVNTLAVRTMLDAQRDFTTLVHQEQAVLQRALAAQSYPFEKVIDVLGVERNLSRNPLFDVFVALEDASWAVYDREPLRMEAVSVPHNTSKFDLSLYFRETAPDCFEVHLEYCTELFREDTIRAMGERLSVLLDDVLQRPAAPLHALAVMPERETALLAAFNATDEPFDNERDVDSCFREQVAQTPHAMAMRDHTGQALSYAQMDARVSALAAHLAAQGLGQGQYAGICFDRSVEMMLGIFAVMRLGAVYVPLSATLPQARLQSMFEDLGGCTVITAAHLAGRFEGCGQRVLVPDMASLPAAEYAPQDISPDSVAYTLFTSGSTGRPKGVQIEHRSLRNRLLWMQSRFPIGQGDVILQKTTVSFDVSIWELFWWSWCGAGLALLEPEGEKDPVKIINAVAENKVTVLHFVPSMLRAFLDYLEFDPEAAGQLASLRYVFTSGEALPADLVERWNALLQAELHNLYGPTEAAIDVTWYPCTGSAARAVPIGRPVSNTRLYVLDGQRRPVPPGVTGELYISGIQVARGYVNRPDLTERSFLPDPFFSGSRMYRTGDLGRWLADGNIEYLGRNDDQVKVRGFRIELGEVEAALNRCSGVSQAVVRVCRVGGYDALEAFVLPHAGAAPKLGQLRAELAAMVPEYMLPSLFHLADAIPLSPSGKADRKAMQGRPLHSSAEFAQRDEQPLYDVIRSLWHRVMPEVTVADPELGFFEAGGNSLLLVQLHALLEERWPGVFSLAGLFADSSIRKQAERIEESRDIQARRGQPGTEQIRAPEIGTGQVQAGQVHAGQVHTGQAHSVEAPASQAPTAQADHHAPVAIIGMAVRVGDYEDAERFWEDIAGGVDKNIPLPEKRQREVRQIFEAVGYAFDAAKLREASYLADISSFDHKRFGLSPGDASMLDPKQRLFLEVAAQALDDAGYGGAALENRNVGTFVGASPYRLFQDAVTRAFPDQSEQIYLLNVPSNVVARLSYLKNWSGPAATVDTACSSVLKAVHDACQSLRSGESCVALAGGVHTIDLPVKSDTAFTIEAASGRTRTFDAAADGVGAGEGAAVFVLKLLDAAVRDNDAIHAVIAGSAVNQDGRSSSMAAPNPDAQAEVITLAARNAGVPLSAMSFFEAHGTATVLGDPVEVEGLTTAFARAGVRPEPKALIGSVKGNIGHLDAAAGAAGLARAVLSLRKGLVPPQPHFASPNPHIDFDAAPVRVARSLEPLAPYGRPWHCGVSSFGLSGVNTHIVLREYGEHGEHAPQPETTDMWYCIPLSAGSEAGLRAYCRNLRDALVRNGQVSLHAVAATLVAGREHLNVRAAFVVDSVAALVEQLGGDILPVHCGRERQSGVQVVATFAGQNAGQPAAEAFAQAYLQGATPLWPEDVPLHRVHLPATPFDRTSLWPRFADTVLSGPVETPDGMAYSVAIDRADFWPVAEHRLQGIPTLVGMGMAELAGKALGSSSLVMEGLRWQRPVTHEEGSRATLFVKPQGAGFALSLRHGRNGEWETAVSATAYVGTAPASVLDIAALRSSMREQAPEGGAAPVTIGRRWHCREELLVSEDGSALLARLSLPEEFRHDLHTYKWHPAMMDIAASLALHGAPGFIPAQCGQMRLHKPLPAVACAYVRITERLSGMITADCTITDSAGVVLVEMRGLVFMSPNMTVQTPAHTHVHTSDEVLGEIPAELPAAAAQRRQQPEPELYELGWQRVRPEPVFPPAQGRLLVLDATGCAAAGDTIDDAVGDAMGNSGVAARYGVLRDSLMAAADLVQAFPQEREAQQALAATIVHEGVDRIACLLPDDACPWDFGSLMREVARAGLRRSVHITAVGNGALAPCTGCTDSPDSPDSPDSKGFTDNPDRMGAAGGHPATPEHALALGLLLSLKQEEPLIATAYAELESSRPESVAAFMASLGHMDGAYRVSADGDILVGRLERAGAPSSGYIVPECRIASDGCIVITGGLGGMGLTLAEQIRSQTGAQVVLLHRGTAPASALPYVTYRCDVTDAGELAKVFGCIRREIGPVQGVIHAAGVAGNGFLVTKERDAYEAVLAPKVTGTWNLHNETLQDNLRFFVLASSRTSLVGAPGQCDYTGANAFLNGFAAYRRQLGLPALALCWNTWSGVGMAARLHSASDGHTLAPEQAFGVLDRALSCSSGLAVVAMSDEDVASYRLASWSAEHGLPSGDIVPAAQHAAEQHAVLRAGADTAPVLAGAHAEAELLAIFKDCLGYDAELSREDDFFDLGGDSISGTRIVSRVDKAFGIKASVIDLLESDTLGDFMDRVLAELKKAAGTEPAQAPAQVGPVPAPAREKYPVGREQLSILYADLLGDSHLGYNLPAFLKLPDNLDKKRLEEAVGTLIMRHEVLRTSFCDFETEHPQMVVHAFDGFTLEESHIPDLSAKDAFITPFDLKKERGFRVRLLVVGGRENILFYDIHHALADGRTISLINTELFRLYHGKELAPVTLQQKDMAWYQFTQDNSADREYWLSLFSSGIPRLDLPADYPRPPVHTNRGGMHEFVLSPELVSGIRTLARREGATNYHIVLTAWALLAHMYAKTDDVVIAITVDSRGEHHNTAGMLASLLPLRFAVDSGGTLGRLLAESRRVSNDGLRHSAYILNNLLTDLHPPVSPDRSLLSEVILSYMNFEFASGEAELFEALRFTKGASKTDLSIFASDTGAIISFALEYYADLFRHETVVRMGRDLVRILETMVACGSDEPVVAAVALEPLSVAVSGVGAGTAGTAGADGVDGSGTPPEQRPLSPELHAAMMAYAARHGEPVSTVVLATFGALLSRVTGQERFVLEIGQPEPCMVPFAVTEDTEFAGLLAATGAHLRSGGIPQVHEESLLRIGFAVSNGTAPVTGMCAGENRYHLFCTVHERADGMTLCLEHDAQKLAAETVQDWLGYFVIFLEGITMENA